MGESGDVSNIMVNYNVKSIFGVIEMKSIKYIALFILGIIVGFFIKGIFYGGVFVCVKDEI